MKALTSSMWVSAALWMAAGAAHAQGPRVVVLPFEGRYPAQLREKVVEALRPHVEVVSPETFQAATPSLSSEEDYATAARESGVVAVLSGETRRRGRATVLTVTVRGSDGQVIRELVHRARTPRQLLRFVGRRIWGQVESDIVNAAPPAPPPEREPMEAPPESDEAVEAVEADDSEGGGKPSPLQLYVGLRLFNRSYDYSDDVTAMPIGAPDGLRAYEVALAPAVEMDFVFYPFALSEKGFLADIGLEGGFVLGLFLNSTECRSRDLSTQACVQEVDFPTSASGVHLGLRTRFHVDDHELYLRAGYQSWNFRIQALNVENPAPQVPDAGYDFLRFGGGARLVFAPVVIEPQAAILLAVGTGQISEDVWFPDSSALAFEAGLRVGVQLLDWFEVMAGFQFQQVGISLNDGPGSATDRLLYGTLGAQLRIPGSEE